MHQNIMMNPYTTHNHRHCVHQALATAEHLCRERGVRFTALRRHVLELIWADHCAVKAYELLDRLNASVHSAKPATVYRALAFLAEQGLIHRVESLNAYIGCSSSAHPHEILLLICRHCGKVEERTAPGVMTALNLEISQADFLPHQKALEIQGLCAHCVQQGNPPV